MSSSRLFRATGARISNEPLGGDVSLEEMEPGTSEVKRCGTIRGTVMTVRELIDMLGQYPPNADVEVVGECEVSMPLARDGLAIDPNGETLYLWGCDLAQEWD